MLKTSIWLGLLSFFALIVYFGLLQFIFVPDTRFLFFLGWDDHYARLLSTLFDPGFTGLICCLGGLIALDWLISQDHTQEHWQLKSSSLVVLISGCALACLLTYSRATFLTFVSCCGLLSLWFWQKNLRLSLCSLAVAIVFISAIFSLPRPGGEGVKLERTSTITSRTSAATAVLATLRSPSDWLVGHGLFQPVSEAASLYSETTSHGKQPDNWVILLLSGVGVVGSGLIFVSLWMLGRRIFFSRKLIGVGVLAIAIHGLFNASLTYPFVLLVMGTWAALTLES